MGMRVAVVTGTRPQIIKSIPLLHALENENAQVSFIHTGQHYDYEMAAQFVDELSTTKPKYNLKVGSGTGVYQIHEIMMRLEKVLTKVHPDCLVVPGDTNSALAAALTGFKLDIPTAHLEAGLRSFDMVMQEEVNRRLIDHGSSGLFAPTLTASKNLKDENVRGTTYRTGDTMYDILKDRLPKFGSPEFRESVVRELSMEGIDFAVLTLHRRENVDREQKLRAIMKGFSLLDHEIVFPIHPRTREKLAEASLAPSENVHVISPVSYDKMMGLVSQSSLLLTDSGGLQKEAYLLNTPCVTIRDNTEWVETLEAGANVLTSTNPEDIISKAQVMWGKHMNNDPNVYGDGAAAEKIAQIIISGQIEIKTNVMRS